MMNKQSFTKAAKRILHPHAALHSPQIVRPNREWFNGLVIASIIFGAIAYWSMHNYTKYNNISIEGNTDTDTNEIVYRESLVNAALASFEARKADHEILLSGLKTNVAPVVEEDLEVEDAEETVVTTDEVASVEGDQSGEEVVTVPDSESNEVAEIEGE